MAALKAERTESTRGSSICPPAQAEPDAQSATRLIGAEANQIRRVIVAGSARSLAAAVSGCKPSGERVTAWARPLWPGGP